MEKRVELLYKLFEQDFEELLRDIPSDDEFNERVDNDDMSLEEVQQDAYEIGCLETLHYVLSMMDKYLMVQND